MSTPKKELREKFKQLSAKRRGQQGYNDQTREEFNQGGKQLTAEERRRIARGEPL
jgi:hypothetical protein